MRRVVCSLLLCALFGVVLCETASGQGKKSAPIPEDQQSIQALLKEVHLMRLALERATTVNLDSFHAQLSVERLRIQQEHVDRLARQLDLVRSEILELKTGEKQLADRVRELDEIVKTGTDVDQVKQAEIELKQVKSALEQQHDKVPMRSEQERQFANQLQLEQLKLDEMSSQLEKLERKLQSASPDTPTPQGAGP